MHTQNFIKVFQLCFLINEQAKYVTSKEIMMTANASGAPGR